MKSGISHPFPAQAGTFHADLYGDVSISIYPPTFSEGMFSWFPLFLPFSAPVRVDAGGALAVSLWRRSDPGRAWYEWAPTAPVVLPIHNPNGRSCAMLL